MTNTKTTRGLNIAIWAPVLLAIAIFAADACTPRGVVLCTAYIPLIYFGLRFSRTRIVFLYAAIASVLTVGGAFLKHSSAVSMWMLLTNRIVNVVIIWWTAEMLFLYRAAKDALNENELFIARREAAGKSALLATIVDFSGDAIIGKSLNGIISSWNRGAERLFGYAPDEAIGKSITMLIPGDLIHEENLILSELIMGKALENMETVRMHKSGRRIEVAITVSPVRDADGRVIGASKSVREIGIRKGTEAMLAAVVDNALDGLIVLDQFGNVETFNRACQKMFGYTEKEVIGSGIRMLVPRTPAGDESGDAMFERRTGIFQVTDVAGKELTGMRKDGGLFPMELSMSAFQLAGASHFSGVVRDLTEKRRVETEAASYTQALIRSNQALDEFAYAASHDLKAPLRVIDNTSKWLEEDLGAQLTGEMRENMQLLRGRVKRMEKLLNDLLSYSRIGRKADAAFTELIPGNALMTDVLIMASPPEGFQIVVDPEFDHIQVCRMPLQQIFMNLIGNAIKHHDRALGVIEITLEPGLVMHTFTVRDDGPGIDPKFHARIFEMFQTLKPRDQVEGSGMGLAMVRKYVQLMGGTITVDSDEGKGSCFRFTWPVHQPGVENTVTAAA
jgi:two-component system sensor kinase FixL